MVGGGKGASSRPLRPQPLPWLMFTHGKSTYIQTFYNVAENRCLMRRYSDLSDNNGNVSACCEGWLVITEDNYTCFLLNLVSMEKILLPPLREDFNFRLCILSSSPSSSNCMLVFVSTSHVDDTNDCIMLWRPKQESWVEWEINVCLLYLTVCDGKFYGLEINQHLVVVDIMGNEPPNVRRILNKTPKLMDIGTICLTRYLVESCGDIFLVYHHLINPRRLRAIQVFKFDRKNIMDWVEVNDLDDRVFFLNKCTGSFSCSASKTGLQRNSIYFMGNDGTNDKKNMYWYNVAEDRLYRTLPCPNVIHDIQQRCWIMIKP